MKIQKETHTHTRARAFEVLRSVRAAISWWFVSTREVQEFVSAFGAARPENRKRNTPRRYEPTACWCCVTAVQRHRPVYLRTVIIRYIYDRISIVRYVAMIMRGKLREITVTLSYSFTSGFYLCVCGFGDVARLEMLPWFVILTPKPVPLKTAHCCWQLQGH